MSANTESYWKKIQEAEANPVKAYQSRWQPQLDNALNAINNRKAFTYDFNADPLYQAYKDQYTKLGKEASMNAAANAAALTGGYGNSYAVTAGAQANQQYLTRLNEVIPELYNLAMNRYKMEGEDLNNRYAVLGDAEDRDYGRHRDDVGDWKDKLNYLQGAYGTQLANDQFNAELAEKIREFDLEYALKNRPMGGGGGGTTVIYKNGKPVETKQNPNGLSVDQIYSDMVEAAKKKPTTANNELYNLGQQAVNAGLLTNDQALQLVNQAKKEPEAVNARKHVLAN